MTGESSRQIPEYVAIPALILGIVVIGAVVAIATGHERIIKSTALVSAAGIWLAILGYKKLQEESA